MKREKIELTDTGMDLMVKMSEGNPGALSVLVKLMATDDPLDIMLVLHLDDMNIRGAQIWIGYKDHCGEDIEKFKEAIRNRDLEMVNTINNSRGLSPGTPRAVEHGASSQR